MTELVDFGAVSKSSHHENVDEITPSRAHAAPDRDAYVLARSGKKEVLKRRFGLFSMSSLAIAGMVSWEGVIQDMTIGLNNGGPAGLLWGILVAWLGMQSVFYAMGELASMMPTAGGQYHWAAVLAPKPLRSIYGYITGYVTVVTWIATHTATAYGSATVMIELISFMIPSYQSQRFHATLVMWGLLISATLINTVLGALLPLIELASVSLHVFGFFAMLIPLINLGPKGNAHELFTTFYNGGGWSSNALSFFVGLVGNTSAIVGTDGAIHMSEEIQRAEINAPRSLTLAVTLNGLLSFVIMFVFLYVGGPPDDLLEYPGQYPFIQIIYTATGSRTATCVLTGFISVMIFAATISSTASGSRMVWAFARDRGLPFSRFISIVQTRHSLPLVAICTVVLCACLLGLIQIGSTIAFNIIISIITAGYYASYLCALLPLLYHRVRGHIAVYDTRTSYIPEDTDAVAANSRARFTWGPWRAPGLLGTLNNLFAVFFLLVAGFFTFWPPDAVVDAQTLNYSSVVLGGVAILSALYYALRAHRSFKGPIVEVNFE